MGLLLPPYALLGGPAALAEPPYTFANTEAETLVAAMTVTPNGARKALIDTFIGALKTAGVWSKIDVMWVLAAHHEQAGRLNWKSPGSFTLTAVNTVTFTVDRGFAGDGSSGYLDTGWDPATNGVEYKRDDAHASLYGHTSSGNGSPTFGSRTNFAVTVLANGSTQSDIRINGGSSLSVGTNIGPTPVHVLGRRSDSSTVAIIADGSVTATGSRASSALSSVDLAFGMAGNSYSSARLSGGSLGSNLDDAQAFELYSSWYSYMMSVGADT